MAYSLEPGNVGGPIKTNFGYHLIKLIDKQGEKISTQHLLRTISFSEKDRVTAYSLIKNISSQIENNSTKTNKLDGEIGILFKYFKIAFIKENMFEDYLWSRVVNK